MTQELIVGCYTKGDYEREAHERLIPSVESLGLSSVIREIPSLGSWVKNGFACQLYTRKLCDEFPDADFLFLDVDAVVHSDPWPYLRELDCDAAVYHFRNELLTGTLYLPHDGRRAEMLDRWIELNEKSPTTWDQENLKALLPVFNIADLPVELCCIFDTGRRLNPGIVPVIEHWQASRRLRNRV